MKSTVALPITIVLAWIVDYSFGKNSFAANSGTKSTTEEHKITGKFELGSVRKEKSQEALQEFVQRLAKTSSFRQLSLGKGSSKFLRQKSSTLANLTPRLFSETDEKDLKELFSRKLPSPYRKLETLCEGLCDGGVPPSKPALEISDIDGDGVPDTCQVYDDFVKAFPVDSDTCVYARSTVQPFCCGDFCEGVCDGGVPPLNPELGVIDIDGDGIPETCQYLDEIVKLLYQKDSDICVDAMLNLQPLCCEERPSDFCEGLCDGGTPVINPTTQVLDIDGDGILPETCQYLDDNIKYLGRDSNFCQITRFEVAPYCCQTRVPRSSKAPNSCRKPKSSKTPKALF
eukprot:CAMPEP_0184855194 /NCGR_PEP_ID=MMETSP0580-20130426/503_1 /TAXON_ID=1118495 /ORGANISM="Dactyliosolen fragilissimus" /LENGTH=342 /DNA_ID=CAMNT_0027349647 /DNA_START=107 /DNA_END=1135 /DNA_ORIENTATION=-